jgi:hypothetical protein
MKRILFLAVAALLCVSGLQAQTTVIEALKTHPVPEIKWKHNYSQVLWMKMFLASVDMETIPHGPHKARDKGESHVYLTFEQALDVIRRVDNLTLGIPKIIYVVGWQYNGHDSKYPAWGEVNPKLKLTNSQMSLKLTQQSHKTTHLT